MTVTTEAPYSGLAAVYDRWMAADRVPYQSWATHVTDRFEEACVPVRSVLDLCCGTGMMLTMLQERGYEVTGVDASAQMLAHARRRAAAGTRLHLAALPSPLIAGTGPFDAVTCCYDGVNYFASPGQLEAVLAQVRGLLRPGGVFVFDLGTRRSFQQMATVGRTCADFGDFAYLWDTRPIGGTPRFDYLVTVFTREEDGRYTRTDETHRQRWFSTRELQEAVTGAGLETVLVCDDYGTAAPGDHTLRETWTVRRPR
ncbi:class I SAM-dependent DNA methyltransferase [Nocardiopsis ganjiahuensis]|uniref:class I SAM-dependent DNA methyltransferase n=1 Tax=Nocardiopsis ganjiahuensis TaxID=239984 RepID=UPI0004763C39|nr:class I SAM-dependent methyltransferase [Nocardiopsis ganjiahuensis]